MNTAPPQPEPPWVAVTGSLLLGGSSTFLLNLTRAFQERGLTLPIVVLSEQNEHARDFAALNSPVTLISEKGRIYEDRIQLGWQAVARWRPRGVLACLGSESFEVARLMPEGVRRVGLIQSHDPAPHELVRQFAPWLDVVVGVSGKIAEHSASFPELQGRTVTSIPYGIRFGPEPRRTEPAPSTPLRLIYLGRMIEEQKRVRRLVELARLLRARQVPFALTLAGSGPELASLKATLADWPEIRFAGEVANSQVPALLAEHDVFVLLSDYEGLPLSLLEAMGAGLVPVVSDLESGIREVVGPATGVRVPVGDVHSAATAVEALASDRARWSQLSRAAAHLARTEYSAARMAERYLSLVPPAARPPVWPEQVSIPRPIGVAPGWLYEGWGRALRRQWKRFRS